MPMIAPAEENGFLADHARRLLDSYRHWTGHDLIAHELPSSDQPRALYYAPFVVLSHNTEVDPILDYANCAGLNLFELSWDELTRMPSRLTAEPLHQPERARLLAKVSRHGFIDNYKGVRIAKSGRRFGIEKAKVWKLLDETGAPCGQAATFGAWKFLD